MSRFISEEELRSVIDLVSTVVLREEARPIGKGGWPCDSARLVGVIGISGAFDGSVTVECTPSFVRRVARSLGAEDLDVSDEEVVRDVLAELTNIIGGNIKSLFTRGSEEPCRLSLPSVLDTVSSRSQAQAQRELWSAIGDDSLVVRVIENVA